MRVALVYDRVNKWGGAERVLLALNKLFPNAPLFTSVHHKKTASWADIFDIKTSFLQKFPLVKTKHEFFPFLMPSAFESFSFDEYDLVISVTSEAAKGIITKPHTKHISYILTPTRYLWSGYDTYFPNKSAKIFSKPMVSALRSWDKAAAQRPDLVVAISDEVKNRIKKYYGREATVIYPPVTLIDTKQAGSAKKKSKQGYFLIVSRLSKFAKYKRVDLAIEAFNELKLPLKIVGSGSWEKELRKKAGSTIEFVGGLTDRELVDYYKECDALVFPGVEDFGLTMVEALKFGRPVIAFKGGGALEIVTDGKTGHFFEEQKPESLIKALKKFKDYKFDKKAFEQQIEKFSFDNFKKNFQSVVNKLI